MKRNILVLVLVLVASGVLGAGIYVTRLVTPPPMPQTIDDALAVIKSPRFTRLPVDRKLSYAERFRQLVRDLDEQQRRQLWEQFRQDEALRQAQRDLMQQMMIERARQFAMAGEAQRQQILDQFIGRMQAGRGRWGGRGDRERTPEEQQRRDQWRDRMMTSMQERAATGNPQHDAYVGEFFKAMRSRRAELGSNR